MCSDQMICIKCVLTDVFTNLAHHRGLRTCFPKETKRRERSKTYFSSPQKSLLKRILAAIGALYVGIGMGLVMGMGWDEGGVFVSCRDLSGMSFSCGTQLSTDCEREGPTAPWVGSLSPIEAFLVCPFSVGSSSQVSVRGRGMSHVATLGGTAKLNCFPFQTYIQKNAAASNIETFYSRPSEAETGHFRGCVLTSVGLLSSSTMGEGA